MTNACPNSGVFVCIWWLCRGRKSPPAPEGLGFQKERGILNRVVFSLTRLALGPSL